MVVGPRNIASSAGRDHVEPGYNGYSFRSEAVSDCVTVSHTDVVQERRAGTGRAPDVGGQVRVT